MDFAILDDILPEMDSLPSVTLQRVLQSVPVSRIGPLVEYAHIQVDCPQLLPSLTTWTASAVVEAYLAVSQQAGFNTCPTNTSPFAEQVEFTWAPSTQHGFASPRWAAFRKRFQDAAQRSGLSKTTAQGITGACDEMVSNGFEHSERPDSSIVGYRWRTGEFEYVITDRGIGILASLRQHPDYFDLRDMGTALRTALTDGESRFGRGSKRGHGFRHVFLSLAQLDGALRFRSGDQRLEIQGQGPALAAARIAQTASCQGFLASFICHA